MVYLYGFFLFLFLVARFIVVVYLSVFIFWVVGMLQSGYGNSLVHVFYFVSIFFLSLQSFIHSYVMIVGCFVIPALKFLGGCFVLKYWWHGPVQYGGEDHI